MGKSAKKKNAARKRKIEEDAAGGQASQLKKAHHTKDEDICDITEKMEIEDVKPNKSDIEVRMEQDKLAYQAERDEAEAGLLPTRHAVARQLLVSIRAREFALIEGPMGCGKTFFASHAASELGVPLRVMQMGDQIDSKSLFGNYHCTEVAGQFHWKPSNFSQWLSSPGLILLEDIDLANSDVIAIVVQIAASRKVTFPSGEVVPFDNDVRIVATVSGKSLKKSAVLEGVACRVELAALSDDELKRLVARSFPRAAHLSKMLTKVFRQVEAVPATGNSRQLTSSDLLRGCARVSRVPDLSDNAAILSELLDTWCLSDVPERNRVLADKVAAALTITADQLSFHIGMRQPCLAMEERCVRIGRCSLPRPESIRIAARHRLGHTRDVLQLMERLAVCVQGGEAVLLVGETGVGKTSVVQALASTLNKTLKVVNLSPTSDSDELIQGYKPTTVAHIMEPFTRFYVEVFTDSYDPAKNQKFLSHIETCLSAGRFREYLCVVETTARRALDSVGKTGGVKNASKWAEVMVRAKRIRDGLDKGAAPFAVTRGAVLEAAQEGHWLLIDEMNLAPPECLDAIVHAISHAPHPDFRLFACMNPATDAGKRRLPAGVRTRFTEFYVAETQDASQLSLVVSAYLPSLRAQQCSAVVDFYLNAKKLFPASYSLRTLCRALLFAADNIFVNEDRSLFEAISMAFLTNLDTADKVRVRKLIAASFKCATNIAILPPADGGEEQHVQVEGYWIRRGELLPQQDSHYVITPTVKENLAEMARIVCSGRFPVLLEGETSAGKTSIVCHLAAATGNPVVRINNHEHTDVQEYMGSYVADARGRLVFREGALVQAVRNGHWVILDELNLAPTDVIETLNRLLDDNRELFVPELNEAISAHPQFRLFATQNPAGSYAGRKRLSRALMSRFVVLRFPHLPLDELSSMVCTRCEVHPSAAKKMIEVLSELRMKRSLSGLFSARDGLMTLRDVFRWAKRLATDETCDDWLQVLANHGYFLLAGRCRNSKDVDTVVDTLQRVLKRDIKPDELYGLSSPYMPTDIDTSKIVMTRGMRQMIVQSHQAWLRDEAVLVVGETGGGKTSLSQTLGRGKLQAINCHERTETADLLGRLRPKHDGGFEWSDGVVISSMRAGLPLLVDEISLAEDSVLERLNPLFEESRCLLLADAGAEVEAVKAASGFQIIATMNPGGDYGKKELSKALRNRFTEIWSSCDYAGDELVAIFESRMCKYGEDIRRDANRAAKAIIAWLAGFFTEYAHVFRVAPSVRDVVACAELFASARHSGLAPGVAVRECVHAVFLDAVASMPSRVAVDPKQVLAHAELSLASLLSDWSVAGALKGSMGVEVARDRLRVGQLSIPYGPAERKRPKGFSLNAPTCVSNFYRLARGLLINKPILMEGAPGCGKSSTVMALAALTGHPITRLNLSDQTDLSDLFGSDVPCVLESGEVTFRWEDGPVLRAIKKGEWVLLDEMNLASQSVLEGLNACFDHRRELYIAELNKSFEIPDDSKCRFFACQNPRAQGGNRRALPKSFVNRFTNIYVDDLSETDLVFILGEMDEKKVLCDEQVASMVAVNGRLAGMAEQLTGGPYSFNLRDMLRWMQLFVKTGSMATAFELLYVRRMRREEDRERVRSVYEERFGEPCAAPPAWLSADDKEVRIGQVRIGRAEVDAEAEAELPRETRLLASQATLLHGVATCVEQGWLSLMVGPRNAGKRAAVESLARMAGRRLETLMLNSETDAQELIGSFEQIVDNAQLEAAKASIVAVLRKSGVEGEMVAGVEAAADVVCLETACELALCHVADSGSKEEIRDALESAARSAMRFEWVDSGFVRAFLEGHWLLIEDVNMCSAAVLDRLNSCLETDGRLVVSERASSFEPLTPHPDFRVFLSMDAKNGEISRAMRNRSVELWVDEEERWWTSVFDVRSMAAAAAGTDKAASIADRVLRAMTKTTAEKCVQWCVLLNELDGESAARTLGVEVEQWDEDEEEGGEDSALAVLAPTCQQMAEGAVQWQLASWLEAACDSCSSPEEASRVAVAWAALAGSGRVVGGEEWTAWGGEGAARVAGRLAQWLTHSHHPLDARMHGVRVRSADADKVKSICRAILLEWAGSEMSGTAAEAHSADVLSRTLSKFEISACEVGFRGLRLVGGLVDALLASVQEEKKQLGVTSISESVLVGWSLCAVLFTVAAKKRLESRAGPAALYLAWTDMQRSEHAVEIPSALADVCAEMRVCWSAAAHDDFCKHYLVRYDAARMAEPFENKQQCERFVSLLNPVVEEDVAMEEVNEDEEEAEKRRRRSAPSPLAAAIRLVSTLDTIHRFMHTLEVDETEAVFASQRALVAVPWRDAECERRARIAAMLNSLAHDEYRVLSVASRGVFSLSLTSFWSGVGFDASMTQLSVADLRKFSVTDLATTLWRLAPNARPMQHIIDGELRTLSLGVPGWSGEEGDGEYSWQERAKRAMAAMRNTLPPADTLDPVVYEEERTKYLDVKLALIDRQLNTLRRWREMTTRQGECDAYSKHPVVVGLRAARAEVEEEKAERQGRSEQCYRQPASQYQLLVCELSSFVRMTEEAVGGVVSQSDGALSGQQTERVAITLAQLHSWTVSASSFQLRVSRTYASFVDVWQQCSFAVSVLLTAVHEAADRLESATKRNELAHATAFPPKFQLRVGEWGVESPELLWWCCRDASPMPLRLKAAVVRKRATEGADPVTDLQWTRTQWQKWYERNVAKATEKDFVYKDKTQEEKDEADIEEFFASPEWMSERERETLPDGDLSTLLRALEKGHSRRRNAINSEEECSAEARYGLALTWIRQVLVRMREEPTEWQTAGIDADLRLLEYVAASEDSAAKGLDVYRATSVKELRRAGALLDGLAARTREVRERWPEVVALRLILEAIDDFYDAPLSQPHMKMATQIEKILEESEEWEKMSDRAHSLDAQLSPIRELLVEWKKMEVVSWASLLERTEADSRLRAQLVAYPLFDALMKATEDKEYDAVVAMSAEWLHHSTLLDFEARVRSVRALATWAEQLSLAEHASRIRSIAAHFAQFAAKVEPKLKEMRQPAADQLKDYLRIVKYKDLNLWNIKVSSVKAHAMLFKIMKKYREAAGQVIAPLMDELIDVEKWSAMSGRPSDKLNMECREGRAPRARQLTEKIIQQVNKWGDVDEVVELAEQTEAADKHVRTKIDYQGEDEEKEKQQGRERNGRQREVAMVIKEAQAVGLSARKAVTLKQEHVNALALAGLRAEAGGRCRERLVRAAAAGRDGVLRRAHKVNEQLGPATRSHLAGVAEYGMHYMAGLEKRLEGWADDEKEMARLAEALAVAQRNADEEWCIDHSALSERQERLAKAAAEMRCVLAGVERRLRTAPAEAAETSGVYMHKLALLHQGHERMEGLKQTVRHMDGLVEGVERVSTEWTKAANRVVYERQLVEQGSASLSLDCRELSKDCEEMREWFSEEMDRMHTAIQHVEKLAQVSTMTWVPSAAVPTDDVLLFVQTMYKACVDGEETWSEAKCMERVERLAKTVGECGAENVLRWLSGLVASVSVGLLPAGLLEATQLAAIALQLFAALTAAVSRALQAVAVLYHKVLSLTFHLFEKGYVNTIPKEEKCEDGNGREGEETGSGGGMGEGQGAKDVTDEMEETGQIEGLQDEEPEDQTGANNDNERPIDMEDDFAEELQDLDREEKDENEKDDEDEKEEEQPETEDQIGDVEQPDEQEVDPKLWDEEQEEEQQKDLDQNDQGADNKTQEMAAKEDEAQEAAEEKQEQEQGEEENKAEEEEGEKEDADMENQDERDREDDGEETDQMAEQEGKDEMDKNEDGDDDEGEENDMDMNEDEKLDKEDGDEENEEKEGEGEEEMEQDEDEVLNAQNEESDEGENEQEEQADAVEEGSGGQKREQKDKEEEGAGGAEEDEEMDEEQKMDDGKGTSKADDKGDDGKPAEAVQKEGETEDEEAEAEEEKQKGEGEERRELAMDEQQVEEQAEEGEGDEMDKGEKMQHDNVAEKQMVGAGTLEEARHNRTEQRKAHNKRRQPIQTTEEDEAMGEGEIAEEGEGEVLKAEIHLAAEDMFQLAEEVTKELVVGDAVDDDEKPKKREQKEQGERSKEELDKQWMEMARSVGILSAELAENLRLILEPQRATKLQGDYRTGKRLNMRRLIPYIASEYRKDRIWMKRTKRAQRDYQVLVAVDDSASMNENGIHQVTCESVCVLDDALRRVDAGAVQVVSFGDCVRTLVPFGETASPGPQLLKNLCFEQSSTDLLDLLQTARNELDAVRGPTSEQLLIIISDGRGALAQGADKVRAALAALQNVTVLFVILDSGSQSINELSVASFKNGGVVLTPYLSLFPFPFYAVVKSITQLPSVLAESIRQWFEMSVSHNM